MTITTVSQALTLLDDPNQDYRVREQAVHYLVNSPTPQSIERLVQALEDGEFGVRWAAAVVLIEMGEFALLPLVRALTQRPQSVWLREGAHHILYYTRNAEIRRKTAGLLEALKGPAAQLTTTEAAFALLQTLEQPESKG